MTLELRVRYPQYEIGRASYGNPQIFSWGETSTLRIGSFCSIAEGVKIFLGGEHRIDWITTFPFNILWKAGKRISGHPTTKGDIVIGNDVWIGREALILSGVTIADGAVVGARAVVTKNVSPYSIAVGNPARVINKRFADQYIEELLNIKWWDWEDSRIEKALPLLCNNNIEDFLQAVKSKKI